MGWPIKAGGPSGLVEIATIGNNSGSNIGISKQQDVLIPMDAVIYDPDENTDIANDRIIVPETADTYMVIGCCASVGGADAGGGDQSWGTHLKLYIDNVVYVIEGERTRNAACLWVFPLSLTVGQLLTLKVNNTANDGSPYIPGGNAGDNWRPRLSLFNRPQVTDDEFQE